jgi:hypothetical protein
MLQAHPRPQDIVQIPLADLQAIRRALDTVAGFTTRSKAGITALGDVYAAYRLAFTEQERARVVGWTRLQVQQAPQGHFLHGLDAPTTFDEALELLGTNAIRLALGAEA